MAEVAAEEASGISQSGWKAELRYHAKVQAMKSDLQGAESEDSWRQVT